RVLLVLLGPSALGLGPLHERYGQTRGDLAERARGGADRGGDADNGSFAGAGRGQILAIEQDDLDWGNVLEARHPVLRERAVEDLAVGEPNGFEEGAAQALDEGAFDLV